MDNIISKFEEFVKKIPSAIAVKLGSSIWTYSDLNNYANFIASALKVKGIQSKTMIAISGKKSFEMIAGIIAILKLNCSYVPIDFNLPITQIQHILKTASVQYLLSNDIQDKLYKFNHVTNIDLKYDYAINKHFNNNLGIDISPDDPAYVMYTSGSTGVPKGAIIPHRSVMRLVISTNYIDIDEKDSVLFHSNTSFDAAIFEIWAALLNGAKIVISPNLVGDLLTVFNMCLTEKITILLLTTGLFHIFSSMQLEKLESLRYLVVGGDIMHSSSAIKAINKSLQFKLINGYGPAENGVFTTCYVISKEADINNPVSIGYPIKDTKVYLLNNDFQVIKQGEIGELYTSGKGLALGYINDSKRNAEKFFYIPNIAGKDLVYRTGDHVKQLENGSYEFVGRQDYQVKVRGFRVELAEIECVISSLSYVEDVCVLFLKPDKIFAFVKIPHYTVNMVKNYEASIVSFLKEKLPIFCLPAHIEISDSFPITQNGKIDRNLLQTQLNLKHKEIA